jgi:NAD+ kinase
VRRLFQGDIRIQELCTLDAEIGSKSKPAINDVVVTSARPGRMVELGWEIGGERLESQPCDGLICATPSGSTAYNLSNGGPVMMWGLDAMAITFVAPHSLHARPLVVPRGLRLKVTNETGEGGVTVLVDGHKLGDLARSEVATVGIGSEPALLALLPEVTFFGRYHEVFD